jgi:hypothetical protein
MRWQQQESLRRQTEQQQTLADEQTRQRLNQERPGWLEGIRRQPGAGYKDVDGAHILCDGQGRIRDIQYKTGDVRFRSFEYDENNELRKMIVDSKTKGPQIWNRTATGQWVDQHGRIFDGSMSVDQQTGAFSYHSARDGKTHTYSASGRWDNPADTGARGARRDSDTTPDADKTKPLSREQYEAAIAKNYGKHEITDRQSYKENLWQAAREGKPVVVTFGRSSDPKSAELLDSLKKAEAASGGKAVYMFIDVDKFDPRTGQARDPNSPIGKYARDYIDKEWGTPMTMVFTQRQGEGRTPVIPERPLYHVVGSIDQARLARAIDEAVPLQRKLNVGPGELPPATTDGADAGTTAGDARAARPTTKDVFQYAARYDVAGLEQRMGDLKLDEREAIYRQAIADADKTGDKTAMAQARAMLGLATMRWASDEARYGRIDDARANFRSGIMHIFDAGLKDPDVYRKPDFVAAVMHSGLPGNAARDLIFRGQSKPDWFFPPQPADRQDKAKCAQYFNLALNSLVPDHEEQRTLPQTPRPRVPGPVRR